MTRVDVHLSPADLRRALLDDARVGLTATPKWLPPKWFYDEVGCKLFDEITRLEEYYPTRCEREILTDRAAEIASRSRPLTLIELGSGTSEKTRLLLDALRADGTLRTFVPFDVSEPTVRDALRALELEYPGLDLQGVVGDFEHHLPTLAPLGADGPRLVAFLGGTIGNLVPTQRAVFLATLRRTLRPGDWLLVGADLVKDVARLEAAYDDADGVTAAFNRNVLSVLNRELEADFDPDRFDHVACWDATNEWIEMRLRATTALRSRVGALDLEVAFAAHEEMRTEISAKFRREGLEHELTVAGFEPVEWWTDRAGDFAVALAAVSAPT